MEPLAFCQILAFDFARGDFLENVNNILAKQPQKDKQSQIRLLIISRDPLNQIIEISDGNISKIIFYPLLETSFKEFYKYT